MTEPQMLEPTRQEQAVPISGRNSGWDNLKPFPKGVSGNPSGRPKGHGEFTALCRAMSQESLEGIATLARTAKNENVRLAAYAHILDRAWGKPVQKQEHGEPGEFETMGREELRSYLKRQALELGLVDVTPALTAPATDTASAILTRQATDKASE